MALDYEAKLATLKEEEAALRHSLSVNLAAQEKVVFLQEHSKELTATARTAKEAELA